MPQQQGQQQSLRDNVRNTLNLIDWMAEPAWVLFTRFSGERRYGVEVLVASLGYCFMGQYGALQADGLGMAFAMSFLAVPVIALAKNLSARTGRDGGPFPRHSRFVGFPVRLAGFLPFVVSGVAFGLGCEAAGVLWLWMGGCFAVSAAGLTERDRRRVQGMVDAQLEGGYYREEFERRRY